MKKLRHLYWIYRMHRHHGRLAALWEVVRPAPF